MTPLNKLNINLLIVKIGFSLCSLYKNGINNSTIFPSSGFNVISKIPLTPNGREVNNKLYKVINQSSIIVCPLKSFKKPKKKCIIVNTKFL